MIFLSSGVTRGLKTGELHKGKHFLNRKLKKKGAVLLHAFGR